MNELCKTLNGIICDCTDIVDNDVSECCAALALLIQLELDGYENLKDRLEEHIIALAYGSVESGATMLRSCVRYEVCCGDKTDHLDMKLFALVFRRSNVKVNNDNTSLYECLATLPPKYLDYAEYGERGPPAQRRKEDRRHERVSRKIESCHFCQDECYGER